MDINDNVVHADCGLFHFVTNGRDVERISLQSEVGKRTADHLFVLIL